MSSNLSRRLLIQAHNLRIIRRLSTPSISESTDQKPEGYLNPDWFRTPQASDGPRCIEPSYPEPPFVSYQARSPYQQYDDLQLRRNAGEDLPEGYEILSTQNFDIEETYTLRYMLTSVAVAGGLFWSAVQLSNYLSDKYERQNAVPRFYP